jgi:large subunit ribosomal protein L32e
MADETPAPSPGAGAPAPAPRSRAAAKKPAASSPGPEPAEAKPKSSGPAKEPAAEKKPTAKGDKEEDIGAPKRPTLAPELARLLRVRGSRRRRQPVFFRQAAGRYYRIGRDGAWRRPRGLQSKQRRHYGYRSQVVSIGFGSPARVRGLAPSGYRPIVVHNDADIEALDPKLEAAVIARTVGTRRRLGLEETAKKRGVRVLNPIQTAGE